MQINQIPGNKADNVSVNIKNAEASATIGVGVPVVLAFNGTDDGLAVILPSSSTAQKVQGLRYGVTTKSLAVGDYGNAIVFGFHQSLLLLRQTRASSTVSWATEAARSVGEYLTIDTVNNGFVTAASIASSNASYTGPVIYNPDAVLAQTLASYAGSASTTTDTRTAITAAVKAFVRLM